MPNTNIEITSNSTLDQRLRNSGKLLIAGLLIEALCLLSARPIAFVIFVAFGGLLMFAGVALYLYSLISITNTPD